jgi:hypothetical protein
MMSFQNYWVKRGINTVCVNECVCVLSCFAMLFSEDLLWGVAGSGRQSKSNEMNSPSAFLVSPDTTSRKGTPSLIMLHAAAS